MAAIGKRGKQAGIGDRGERNRDLADELVPGDDRLARRPRRRRMLRSKSRRDAVGALLDGRTTSSSLWRGRLRSVARRCQNGWRRVRFSGGATPRR